MDDYRLERRLRTDPADDDGHRPGRFLELLAGSAVERGRPSVRARGDRPIGAALVGVAALVIVVLLVRLGGMGPASPPTGSPAHSPIDTLALQRALDGWAAGNGIPAGSVTVIDEAGRAAFASLSDDPRGDAEATMRIGEVSGMFVVSATLILIDCARISQAGCPLQVANGAMRLDDTVSRWLPDSPAGSRTVHQLLDGTSGLAALGTIDELSAQIAADPSADWSRTGVLLRTLALPERFAAGARREPVDTEIALLEELIARAVTVPASRWIEAVTIEHLTLGDTTIGAVSPGTLTPGTTLGGGRVTDYSQAMLDALGGTGGVASDSQDLARFAAAGWGTAIIHEVATVRLLTDAAHGRQSPMGATAYCPCIAGEHTVIARLGHAVGWSALAAYDFQSRTAIAALLAADIPQAELEALLQDLVGAVNS
jgi:CubicO group peptidase (beta-lactamase class C family)